MSAPAGTPEPILKTVRNAVRAAIDDPQFKGAMDARLTQVVRRICKLE